MSIPTCMRLDVFYAIPASTGTGTEQLYPSRFEKKSPNIFVFIKKNMFFFLKLTNKKRMSLPKKFQLNKTNVLIMF